MKNFKEKGKKCSVKVKNPRQEGMCFVGRGIRKRASVMRLAVARLAVAWENHSKPMTAPSLH